MLQMLGEYYSLPQLSPSHPHLPLIVFYSLSTAACIAFLSAAVGTIRWIKPNKSTVITDCSTLYSDSSIEDEKKSPPTLNIQSAKASIKRSVVVTSRVDEGSLGSPRNRFTETYTYDCNYDLLEEEEEVEMEDEEEVVIESNDDGIDWIATEVIRRWKGDLGWYRYQDRTVIDGNVVRLWDVRAAKGLRVGM